MAQSTEDVVPKMRKSKFGKICSAIGCSNYQYSKDRQKLKQQDGVVEKEKRKEEKEAAVSFFRFPIDHERLVDYYIIIIVSSISLPSSSNSSDRYLLY